MSEMLSIFSIVVGFALLLTGVGLVILAKAVFGDEGGLLRPQCQEQLPDSRRMSEHGASPTSCEREGRRRLGR